MEVNLHIGPDKIITERFDEFNRDTLTQVMIQPFAVYVMARIDQHHRIEPKTLVIRETNGAIQVDGTVTNEKSSVGFTEVLIDVEIIDAPDRFVKMIEPLRLILPTNVHVRTWHSIIRNIVESPTFKEFIVVNGEAIIEPTKQDIKMAELTELMDSMILIVTPK